jgi:hypothetical protein
VSGLRDFLNRAGITEAEPSTGSIPTWVLMVNAAIGAVLGVILLIAGPVWLGVVFLAAGLFSLLSGWNKHRIDSRAPRDDR